ncbi:MAG: hypothetical protein Q7R40_12845 [Phaeospirillum sp.]|nr:hypothetical protein [Phaeospirillum sp.]
MPAPKQFPVIAILALLASGDAWADPRAVAALGLQLPLPGATFDDVREIKLADGQRLVCDSDADKPKLVNPSLLELQSARGPTRVRRCSVFQPGGGDVWVPGMVPSLAGPARLWLTFVEQGIGGRFRLAQFSLWAKRDNGWDKVAKSMEAIMGASTAGTDRFLTWQDDQHETMMFIDEKYPDEFAVAIGDLRLRRLLKSPGTSSRPE